MEAKRTGRLLVKWSSVFLLFLVLLYLILGVFSAVKGRHGLGAAFDSSNPLSMILAYGTAFMASVSGFTGLEAARGKLPPRYCVVIGRVLLFLSLLSLFYISAREHRLEYFDIPFALLGIVYLSGSARLKQKQKSA